MDYSGRQTRLRNLLARNRLDALLTTHPPNVRYLCGFAGSAAALLVSEARILFFTDGRYTVQAREQVQGARILVSRKAPLAAAGEWLAAKGGKLRMVALGIEAEHLSVGEQVRLKKALPSSIHLRPAPPLVEQARMVKDAEEIDRLREASLLGASLFDVALRTIRPGVKETEVAAEMEYAARRAGAEGMSFETIIAAGPRSALPHGRASTAAIPSKGFVVCDFGVILSGYCSDMTRTVHVGSPGAEERRMYQAVREAQQAAVDAIQAGVGVSQIDRVARKLLQQQGLARHFTHSTGHGVGLEIHEAPRVAAGQTEVLRPGMAITVEPGIYVPEIGGIRIEDLAVVRERQAQILAPTSKDLITI
jgi:Xaa-Pro aminopeptidase